MGPSASKLREVLTTRRRNGELETIGIISPTLLIRWADAGAVAITGADSATQQRCQAGDGISSSLGPFPQEIIVPHNLEWFGLEGP